jgi:hypothetical protein
MKIDEYQNTKNSYFDNNFYFTSKIYQNCRRTIGIVANRKNRNLTTHSISNLCPCGFNVYIFILRKIFAQRMNENVEAAGVTSSLTAPKRAFSVDANLAERGLPYFL